MIALDEKLTLVKADCLSLLARLPDQCVDTIITDPPYFKVKSEDWDRQWQKQADFFDWLELVIKELQRVLKRNGSLYLFCSAHLEHETHTLIGRYFNVLNRVIWVKPSGPFGKCHPPRLRRYFPQTETIIFAERQDALKPDQYVCEVLREYLASEWQKAGLKYSDAEKLVGSAARHYFSRSQWHMPTQEKYGQMQAAAAPYLAKPYDELITIKNGEQRPANEHLRVFTPPAKMDLDNRPHTNVWRFKSVQFYPGKHSCEKPAALLEHIILTSTAPGAVILDVFAGSCSTAKAALKHGRRFIGCDTDDTYFKQF